MGRRRPGQIYVHNGHWFRIAKRQDGCTGCILNGSLFCPGVKIKGRPKKLDCEELGIILTNF